jgi:hypothetical protein
MNGPEHYKKAEHLLESIEPMKEQALVIGASEATLSAAMGTIIDMAQVHATLAHVDATARASQSTMFTTLPEWREVLDG